jgi:tetratricopeptide (TPR) repeat protein
MFMPIALLCLAATLDPHELLDRALTASDAGDHVTAAECYDQLQQSGFQGGPLFLSQGNAHLLAGQLPEAILAYRRAERFIPNDERLRSNLAEARRQVLDPPATPSAFWPDWAPSLGRSEQLLLASGLWVLGWGLTAIVLFQPGRWLILLAAFALLLAIAVGGNCFCQEWLDEGHPVAIVNAGQVLLRLGNGESYPPLESNGVAIKLNRGVELRLLSERKNGWVRVALADGRSGWLPKSQVLIDR